LTEIVADYQVLLVFAV